MIKKLEKVCLQCNNKFITNYEKQKYCSKNCSRLYINIKHFGLEKVINKKYKKICPICSKEFETNANHKKYCSKICVKEWCKKYVESHKEYYLKNNPYLKLRFEIFKRDNFTCQYCGRNPKEDGCKLQVDHIFPRNKGGEFKSENLTTSCFECNQGKKDVLLNERLKKKEII